MSDIASIMASVQSFADEAVLREFQDFARSAFGIDASGLNLGQVKREICSLVLTKPEARDFYGAAARAIGLRPGRRIFTSRDRQCVLLRYGVWSALVDAGWSYLGVAKSSSALHEWDHSTIINAMTRVAEMEAIASGDVEAKASKRNESAEALAVVEAACKAVRPMASFAEGGP